MVFHSGRSINLKVMTNLTLINPSKCPCCGQYLAISRSTERKRNQPKTAGLAPVEQRILELIKETHQYTGRGAFARQIQGGLGLTMGRTTFYKYCVALREQELVVLEGRRWLPAA